MMHSDLGQGKDPLREKKAQNLSSRQKMVGGVGMGVDK